MRAHFDPGLRAALKAKIKPVYKNKANPIFSRGGRPCPIALLLVMSNPRSTMTRNLAERPDDVRPGEHHKDSIKPATEKASDMTTVAQQREQSNFIDNIQVFLPPDKMQRKRSFATHLLEQGVDFATFN
jgi:hypothetical protein